MILFYIQTRTLRLQNVPKFSLGPHSCVLKRKPKPQWSHPSPPCSPPPQYLGLMALPENSLRTDTIAFCPMYSCSYYLARSSTCQISLEQINWFPVPFRVSYNLYFPWGMQNAKLLLQKISVHYNLWKEWISEWINNEQRQFLFWGQTSARFPPNDKNAQERVPS